MAKKSAPKKKGGVFGLFSKNKKDSGDSPGHMSSDDSTAEEDGSVIGSTGVLNLSILDG